MSTQKNVEKICIAIICVVLAAVIGLFAWKWPTAELSAAQLTYADSLFDTSMVHTIDITIDDWDDFLENCESEEYSMCSVTIDGDEMNDVAIRAKGNTSLSQVKNYDNDRYSFKLEFDHYQSGNTYQGLDKLSLNNIIQDNTYMKDYLTYQMMGAFGVDAPLCSYVYITVNGEDWGLYLAVESVEDSFLERNYGGETGDLYKPDSSSMGGGPGAGQDFDMDDWQDKQDGNGDQTTPPAKPDESNQTNGDNQNAQPDGETQAPASGDSDAQIGDKPADNTKPTEGDTTDASNDQQPQQPDQGGGQPGGDMGGGQGGFMGGGMDGIDMNEMMETISSIREKLQNGLEEAKDADDMTLMSLIQEKLADDEGKAELAALLTDEEMEALETLSTAMENFGGGGDMGGMSMGSDDVKLVYTDDDPDSYSNIFDNAKTNVTDADKSRLIASLKTLNEGEDIESVVNVDEVIRYFVVHNFVCNFDSYTGSMIHNYYLYEEDGVLSMIPWDYNLAFGGFQSSTDATSLVNYPIDTPVSGDSVDSRPMLAWIFADETYTQLYHEYFSQFIEEYFESGTFQEEFERVAAMISPYVEKDPTKFCTTEEFESGVSTLESFCLLRAQSIQGQLEGTIPATSDGQKEDSGALVDASALTISDMGSMNAGGGDMGGGPGDMGGGDMGGGPGGDMDPGGQMPGDQSQSGDDAQSSEDGQQTQSQTQNSDTSQQSGEQPQGGNDSHDAQEDAGEHQSQESGSAPSPSGEASSGQGDRGQGGSGQGGQAGGRGGDGPAPSGNQS